MRRQSISRNGLAFVAMIVAFTRCAPREQPTPVVAGQACLFAQNCGGSNLAPIGPCVGGIERSFADPWPTPYPHAEQELAYCGTATSCEAFRDCLAHSHHLDYCRAHPGGSCDGALAIECGTSGNPTVRDCSLVNAPCNVANGHAACATNRACDPAIDRPHCDGNRLSTCEHATHLVQETDCAARPGWTCDPTASPDPACIPEGPACALGSSHCDGATLVECVNGHEHRVDCAALAGRTCVDRQIPSCEVQGPECSDGTADTCMGNTLQTCIDGRIHGYDCLALGFRRCTFGDLGQSLCSN